MARTKWDYLLLCLILIIMIITGTILVAIFGPQFFTEPIAAIIFFVVLIGSCITLSVLLPRLHQ